VRGIANPRSDEPENEIVASECQQTTQRNLNMVSRKRHMSEPESHDQSAC
jgi:hypothetical protein